MKTRIAAVLAAGALALSACTSSNPLGSGSPAPAPSTPASGSGGTLVVGSQQYYSNEIIAELYAQALEAKGYTITRQYQIGQREVYLPELQAGKIDVLPEYSGNLLQYLDKKTTAKTGEQVLAALPAALGQGLRPLTAASATDQDSYNVVSLLAAGSGLTSIGDLAKLNRTIKVCANSELAKRPYGPPGLKSVYGLDVEVVPVEDSGGPLTVKALKDGKCDVADIYSADPSIAANGLTTLSDPKSLVLPQNVVPIVSPKVDQAAAAVIDKVNAALSTDELVGLNAASKAKQQSSAAVAKDWLTSKGLLG
ncbi:MAG: ABC transporter substrate-binding protein [Micropruina sp.]|uniref:ABC transporter substrate-binding protein n=1 Tax=Micropruina sp. TaxID=2737536 RepID=UPI0039E709BE